MKDWNGNSRSVIATSCTYNKNREENDFYATEPKAIELLLNEEKFSSNIWECACGQGHLAKVLIEKGFNVRATDLIDRGFGRGGCDFLQESQVYNGDIITNPPYKFATEFIYKALDLVTEGHKVAMFLRLQYLESKTRKALFTKYPPKTVYVSSGRLHCAINGQFENMKGNAVCYAWFVWEKGFQGTTSLKWIN